MALFQAFLGEMSGKLNGSVYARNRGGTYVRKWAKPTNPNTPLQQTIRAAMSALVTSWMGTLTDAQRAGWDTYAANVPMLNRLGQEIYLTGQNHYIRSNAPRLQAGVAVVDDAPTTFNLGTLNPISLNVTIAGGGFMVGYDDTQTWCDTDDSYLIIQQSKEMAATREFFKAPFTFASTIDGDAASPPTSPTLSANIYPITLGNAAFMRARLSQADGRLSSVQIVKAIIEV